MLFQKSVAIGLISRSFVFFVAVSAVLCSTVSADEFFIETETGLGQVGGLFGSFDAPDPMDPPIVFAPDNKDGFQNYFMGRTTVGGVTLAERRAFFMFDTAGLAASIPDGHEIVEVALNLDLVFGGVLANFSEDPAPEFVTFTSTPASAEDILAASIDDPDPMLGIFDTFGMGTEYGGFDVFPGSSDTPTLPGEQVIPLPGAIDDLTAVIESGGVFVVTARLATYDPGPIGDDDYEFVFGLTDVVDTIETSPGVFERVVDDSIVPSLSFVTFAVPEPSSMIVLIGIGVGVATQRRRR